MNQTKWRRPIAALVPILIALMAFGALPAMRLEAQSGPNPNTSNCDPSTMSNVAPESFVLGQTAQVQLNMDMSCPDFKLPIDLVFLVDTSNSMTRGQLSRNAIDPTAPPGGGNTNPTPRVPPPGSPPPDPPPAPDPLPLSAGDPLSAIEADPLQQDPPPAKTSEPAPPPNIPAPGGSNASRSSDPPGCEPAGGGGNVTDPGGGGSNLPALPTVGRATPRVTPGGAAPTNPPPGSITRTPVGGGTPPGTQTGSGSVGEPAGTEDLIRDAKEFIRDFVDQPQIQQDLANGTLRLGLVSFNDRGRRLMSLTNEGSRVTGRLSLLRGSGRTRIDLGMRTAEAVLMDRNNSRRIRNEADHTKVIIVISDGAFCARDLRVRVNSRIEVVTMSAGRGPYTKNMRTIASDLAYALRLQGGKTVKDTLNIYNTDFVRTRPVTVSELEITAEFEPSIQVVDGSVNPAGTLDQQTLKWTAPAIDWTQPVTLTYDIRPQSGGLQSVHRWAQVTWKDSESRDGQGVFPALYVEVAGPTATATSEIVPTATPELR